MGNCMGLIFRFSWDPLPPSAVHVADDGLATFMNVNVFDRHLLLALSTVAVQGFHLGGEGAGEFVETPLGAVLLLEVLHVGEPASKGPRGGANLGH